jgi:hypothetical protein
VVASTLPSNGPFVPEYVIWPVFLGAILLNGLTVLRFAERRSLPVKRYFVAAPLWLLAAAVIAGGFTEPLAAHALFTGRGEPERHGQRYYLRNHTELTRVSRAEYRYAERLDQRLFVGGPVIFFLLAVMVHAGYVRRSAAY